MVELKRVNLNEMKYDFIQFETFAYLGNMAGNTPFSKQSSKTITETVESQKIHIVLTLCYPTWCLPATCGY